MRVNDHTTHELTRHHRVDALLLHGLALWSLSHLIWHRWDLKHLVILLSWKQMMILFTVNLHLWLIGRFMILLTFFHLFLVKIVLLLQIWHSPFLMRHVESPLRCCVRICHVFTVELITLVVELVLEEPSWLIHWKVDVSIIEKIVHNTRIPDSTSISILVALTRHMMHLSVSTVVSMVLHWQMVNILLTNGLPLVHVRHRWHNERLRPVKLKLKHSLILVSLMSLLICSDWTWMLCLCKFTLSWILLRHNEIGHLLVSEINLHILIRVNQSLLMLHIWQILEIRAEKLMVLNEMSIIMHTSWQTLTMKECKLMVSLLNWWIFILICLVLTVKRT